MRSFFAKYTWGTATGEGHITRMSKCFDPIQTKEEELTPITPMQKILIIGYLGGDPDLKYTPQAAVIVQFSIATSSVTHGNWPVIFGDPEDTSLPTDLSPRSGDRRTLSVKSR